MKNRKQTEDREAQLDSLAGFHLGWLAFQAFMHQQNGGPDERAWGAVLLLCRTVATGGGAEDPALQEEAIHDCRIRLLQAVLSVNKLKAQANGADERSHWEDVAGKLKGFMDLDLNADGVAIVDPGIQKAN